MNTDKIIALGIWLVAIIIILCFNFISGFNFISDWRRRNRSERFWLERCGQLFGTSPLSGESNSAFRTRIHGLFKLPTPETANNLISIILTSLSNQGIEIDRPRLVQLSANVLEIQIVLPQQCTFEQFQIIFVTLSKIRDTEFPPGLTYTFNYVSKNP